VSQGSKRDSFLRDCQGTMMGRVFCELSTPAYAGQLACCTHYLTADQHPYLMCMAQCVRCLQCQTSPCALAAGSVPGPAQ
jgi:hypothetical protein